MRITKPYGRGYRINGGDFHGAIRLLGQYEDTEMVPEEITEMRDKMENLEDENEQLREKIEEYEEYMKELREDGAIQ